MIELRRDAEWEESAGLDLEFHRTPLLVSGHRRLAQSWDLLSGSLLALAVTTAPYYPDLIADTQRFHQRILDAYARGDVEGIKESLALHVRATEEVMFRMLRTPIPSEPSAWFNHGRNSAVRLLPN
jgi:DNA-binding GntR family transcriptional regulator